MKIKKEDDKYANILQFNVTVGTNLTSLGDIQREWDKIAKIITEAVKNGRVDAKVEVTAGLSVIR